jgi:hypothetical protein
MGSSVAQLGGFLSDAQIHAGAVESQFHQTPLQSKVFEYLDPERVRDSGIQLRMAMVHNGTGELHYMTELGDVIRNENQTPRINGRFGRRPDRTGPTVQDGVLASSAIPLLFEPWIMKGRGYWDGAVREGVPIRKALELGATDLIVVLTEPRPDAVRRPSRPSFTLEIGKFRSVRRSDEAHQADIYLRIKIGEGKWMRTPVSDDRATGEPHWLFHDASGDVAIEILDQDNPLPIDATDALLADSRRDLTPAAGRKRLQFRIDPATGAVSGDVTGALGTWIQATGDDSDRNTYIRFRVTEGPHGSKFDGGLPGDGSLTLLRYALALMGQIRMETGIEDFSVLKELALLHEMAATLGEARVLEAARSFPLPRDSAGNAYLLPNFTVIEPPIVLGAIEQFDPVLIQANFDIGRIVGSHTRIPALRDRPSEGVHWSTTEERLEALKRQRVLQFLADRQAFWSERSHRDGRHGTEADRYYVLFSKAYRELSDLNITPPFHSPTRN